jgi:hypothetical protein
MFSFFKLLFTLRGLIILVLKLTLPLLLHPLPPAAPPPRAPGADYADRYLQGLREKKWYILKWKKMNISAK